MWFLLAPVIVIAAIGLLCLNVKIGFMVDDATAHTGFSVGFYMMTVIGLIAAEVSLALWFLL